MICDRARSRRSGTHPPWPTGTRAREDPAARPGRRRPLHRGRPLALIVDAALAEAPPPADGAR
jgi:hypothetical protein